MAEQTLTLEGLHQIVSKQNEVIAQLQGQLAKTAVETAAPKLPTIPKEAIKHKGKDYKWQVAAFAFPGSSEQMTAEEASTENEKVIAKILAIPGQGLLREQV